MVPTIEQLVEQALALPSESRARLADLLVESLEGDDLGRIEQLWITEAKRRRNEVREGKIRTIKVKRLFVECVTHLVNEIRVSPRSLRRIPPSHQLV
jgi:hypothetical protein